MAIKGLSLDLIKIIFISFIYWKLSLHLKISRNMLIDNFLNVHIFLLKGFYNLFYLINFKTFFVIQTEKYLLRKKLPIFVYIYSPRYSILPQCNSLGNSLQYCPMSIYPCSKQPLNSKILNTVNVNLPNYEIEQFRYFLHKKYPLLKHNTCITQPCIQ